MPRWLNVIFFFLAIFIIYISLQPKGFTDDDVANIENDIREKYQKREKSEGRRITEVHLLRNGIDKFKLSGFIKLRIDTLDADIDLDCSAIMDNKRAVLWQCR